MARTAPFTPIPSVPQAGVSSWEFAVLTAIKENVELLTGLRGAGNSQTAVVSGQVAVQPISGVNFQQVSAQGVGFNISGSTVPSLDDYIKLVTDVQKLASDVANIRVTLNALIQQLKA